MKVWIDFTACAHPLVFRPLVELLRAHGHEVEITARDYAQTIQLIESHGMTATVIGHHGGRSARRQGAADAEPPAAHCAAGRAAATSTSRSRTAPTS